MTHPMPVPAAAPEPPSTLTAVADPGSTPRSFLRVLLHRPPAAGPTTSVQPHGLSVPAWSPPDGLVEKYRQVVGSSAAMPLTFPALIAGRLHRDLMGLGDLPVSGLGMVHVATQLWASGRLPADTTWNVAAWADGARHVRSGLEIDLWASCTAGEASWTARVVVLSRSREASGSDESASPELPDADGDWPVRTTLTAGGGVGRAYASVSGDYNPIHLHRYTAKAFGFPRAIAHGWWALPRSLALIGVDEAPPEGHTYLDVAYRRPVLLPSRPTLKGATDDKTTAFLVVRDDGKPHFGGHLVSA
jgi:acyl dehydratase